MSQPDLRVTRPIRFRLAQIVYRLIWWPAVAVALPFIFIGHATDWLADRVFPLISLAVQPGFGAFQDFALRCGNAVLGYRPEEPAE